MVLECGPNWINAISTSTGLVGEGLLMAYGQGSFRAPDLAAYDVLVHDAIYSLPLHTQQTSTQRD
jgi:hypothetical protein